MRLLDLFAGIGGFSLAAHWMGWTTEAFVERDAFCQKVLRKNFGQDIEIHDDICTFSGKPFRGRVNIVTGGFPCQDVSTAGSGVGIEGEGSGLYKELLRVIDEVRPRFAVMENVAMLINRGLARVLGDLAEIGYDAEWRVFSACELGFPHSRERVFLVAYPYGKPRSFRVFDWYCHEIAQRNNIPGQWGQNWLQPEMATCVDSVLSRWHEQFSQSPLVRRNNGIPDVMDRLKSLGNSIVPTVAYEIFRAIEASKNQ